MALDSLEFRTPGASAELRKTLMAASLVNEAGKKTRKDSQDLFAAAQADYGRILGALYAEGRYSAVIHILIDGREAADIAPLEVPDRIRDIRITVEPGPEFHFAKARMRPYAPGTDLPGGYADGAVAKSTEIADAAQAGVAGWRAIGHAKARIANEAITADHQTSLLESWIYLDAGPKVRFGTMSVEGTRRMRPERVRAIAGFPQGEVFDPKALDKVATRLRRTGVFRSVSLTEADKLAAGDTLGVTLTVVEEKKRRFGVGADIASSQGLSLNGYWLHRNLFGGAERLRFDAAITGIGGQAGGTDYAFGVRLDRPATFNPDTSAFAEAGIERQDEVDYSQNSATFGFGLARAFSDHLTGDVGLSYFTESVKDVGGWSRTYRLAALPVGITWDNRDSELNATKGYFLDAEFKPFLGFGTTGTGARITGDARAYRAMGDRLVLAGRAQVGTVLGTTLLATPRDYLFFSGGAGTVRGQPYQSLGVNVLRGPNTVSIGGQTFIGLSGELRARITDQIGVVGFYDAGYISALGLGSGGAGTWQSGAGLGLRYDTGIGPIRLDIAAPVSGPTGKGVQIYVGLGQSF